MAAIRFRSCVVEGSRADAVLAFQESLSDQLSNVVAEIDLLNTVPADRRNEAVVLTGQTASTLLRTPVSRTVLDPDLLQSYQTAVPDLTELPDQQGTVWRSKVRLDRRGALIGGTVDDGALLINVSERAIGHWMFDESSPTANARDTSVFSKTGIVSGTLPVVAAGPFSTSRQFSPGNYFVVPTGQAILTMSQQMTDLRSNMAGWAWVRADSFAAERPILSFTSPPTDRLVGTVTLVNGSVTVVGTGTAFNQLRAGARLQFNDEPAIYVVDNITSDTEMDLTVGWGSASMTTHAAQAALTGTLSVTNGSDAVTGVGTNFLAALQPFDRLVLPDGNLYEILSVAGQTSLTLGSVYTGTTVSGQPVVRGSPFQPKNRNTLYALSVTTAGKLRYWCEHHQRQTAQFESAFTVPADEFCMVGVQRRIRQLVGLVSTTGLSVTGFGTDFVADGVTPGSYIQFDGIDGWWLVDTVAPTALTLISTTALPDVSGIGCYTTRTSLWLGKLDGTFTYEYLDGLPLPDGGAEPGPAILGRIAPNAVANLYIGHDASRPTLGWVGDMDAVTLFAESLDRIDDPNDVNFTRVARYHFTRAFPDFVMPAANQIARNVVSDIPDGATVYAFYSYITGINDSLVTTGELEILNDGLLSQMGNTEVNSMSSLSAQVNGADPTAVTQADIERALLNYGLMVSNGDVLIRGSTDLTAYRELVRTVGSADTANSLITSKPLGSFILVAITEDITEQQTIDACGRPSTTVLVTERVVGIDKNLHEAALAAGFTSSDTLKLKLWWLGRVADDVGTLAKMRRLGLNDDQIGLSLLLRSNTQLTTFLMGNPYAGIEIKNKGLDLDGMLINPPITVNTNPSTGDIAAALQVAMVASPGVTADGDGRPDDPALLVASVVDVTKACGVEAALAELEAVISAADQDCAALAAILESCIRATEQLLSRVSSAIVPFAIRQRRSFGTQKLTFNRYIPCVANVSASFGAPPFRFSLAKSVALLDFAREQAERVIEQALRVIERFNDALCIPRTLLAALRGGVCGIEQPKVVANRECPTQLDLLLERLQQLLDTIDLLLRRIAIALTTFTLDIELSGGAASSLAADFSIPCIGQVASFMTRLG